MEKFKKNALDLWKIGVFLIGVSAVVISAIALHLYFRVYSEAPYKPQDFYAYCQDKTIIISANKDLTDVEVLDNQSKVVCGFPRINANSDELCSVDSIGIYQVKYESLKKIVSCREAAELSSPQIAD